MNQPQIQSKNFVSRYEYDGGLVLDIFGHFDASGDFMLEAVGLAGTLTDVSNLISSDLSDTITSWCEFMASTWRESGATEPHLYAREMAVAF